jgi:oligoendopeptidase F
MAMNIPNRHEVPEEYRWNLASLYPSEEAFEKSLELLKSMQEKIDGFKAGITEDARQLRDCLAFYAEYLTLDERLGYYAHLRMSEDEGEAKNRARFARYLDISTKGQGAWAWLNPAIQGLGDDVLEDCIDKDEFSDFRIFLKKLKRMKPHILSDKEERLLALQAEVNQTAQESFSVLTNVDFVFGSIDTPEGAKELSQSTFASFLRNHDRSLRKRAYEQFYAVYDAHKTTLASLYSGSIKLDKYFATVRGYPDAREMSLFPDAVPGSVYDNLVATIGANLGVLHDYYALRTKALGLAELRHYDVYVPLVEQKKSLHTYEEAVDIVCAALAPLGDEYVFILRKGLLGGWVDRYENKGKRSGAFSAGSYAGDPYILLNYKDDVLRDLFTLAHEGGHSMHSWHSARNNPFLSYSYTIFEAEVASTFNEHLVFDYLFERSDSDEERAALLSNRIDDSIGTLFRQTMFAEFEAKTHGMIESGEALTVDSLREEFGALQRKYFGPSMVFEPCSDLEGLRIPHFYNAFYVYKYATGISASKALAALVLGGGKAERDAYFAFLKSGGSRFPIESLNVAGVDMTKPEPIEMACESFARDVERLKQLLGYI